MSGMGKSFSMYIRVAAHWSSKITGTLPL